MGGATADLIEVGRRLNRDHEVRVFIPQFPPGFSRCEIKEEAPFDIERIRFNPLTFNALTAGRRFRAAVEAFKPDHVWVSDGWHLKPIVFEALKDFSPLLRIYAYENLCLLNNGELFRKREPCPTNFLESPSFCRRCAATQPKKGFWYRWEMYMSGALLPGYERKVTDMFKRAEKIIVYNEFTRRMLEHLNSNVVIIPSGIDTSVFTPAEDTAMETEEHKRTIFVSGRMDDPCKGMDFLAAALDMAYEQRKDFEVRVTGSPKISRPYVKKTGWLNQKQLIEEYRRCRFAAVPSLWPEPQGIVVLEAGACGKPVIGTNTGGIPGLIQHEKTGLLIDPFDVKGLAGGINRLLDDDGFCVSAGRAAREYVCDNFDWERVYCRYYERLFF